MAIGLPGDNCVDLYANDLGLMAICRDWKIVGYNVLVGGSMGVTPSAAKTFPAVAKRMAFMQPDQAVDVADGDRESAARFRQPRRPQSGAAEISDRQPGARMVQGQGRRILSASRWRRPIRKTSAASTITWAGTSKATAECSTA